MYYTGLLVNMSTISIIAIVTQIFFTPCKMFLMFRDLVWTGSDAPRLSEVGQEKEDLQAPVVEFSMGQHPNSRNTLGKILENTWVESD